MVTNRSNYYSVGTWMPATTDFILRAIVDYNIVGVEDGNVQTPIKFGLQQNYPNPFNAKTTMNYSIPNAGDVKLDVFNLLGQHVTTLVNEHQDQGEYSVNWDANDLPSGVYFAKLTIENSSKSIKLMLLK